MTVTTLPAEYFTEAKAMDCVICPLTRGREAGLLNCIGSTCGAWRWKHIGTDPGVEGHVGFCGLGGKP